MNFGVAEVFGGPSGQLAASVILLAVAAAAFALSASAGFGGSLILVPAAVMMLGPKEGVAAAALLLAANNVAKVLVYRGVVPWVTSAWMVFATVVGAAVGAALMVAAPESWVAGGVAMTVLAAFVIEWSRLDRARFVSAPVLALLAGATSGFSGTSGPLKGLALRALNLDRARLVGSASVVSLSGDLMKATIYTRAALVTEYVWVMFVAAIPLMVGACLLGRHLNSQIGTRGYAALFWLVMAGYSARLLLR